MSQNAAPLFQNHQDDAADTLLRNIRQEIDRALNADAARIDVNCSALTNNGKKILSINMENHVLDGKTFSTIVDDAEGCCRTLRHEALKDYILWFTRFGSVELEFGNTRHAAAILLLKGFDREEPEMIAFGHVFPAESGNPDLLFEQYGIRSPQYYCKRFQQAGVLRHFPEIPYKALFYIEGDKVKTQYNSMLVQAKDETHDGAYTVQDRYGVWLCRDYMPVERRNNWIVKKLLRTTDFHAFFNCQALPVVDNRLAVEDASKAILADIEAEIREITEKIAAGDDQTKFDWLVYSVCSGL